MIHAIRPPGPGDVPLLVVGSQEGGHVGLNAGRDSE